ncbi:MAG: alpha/beta fold hydrolase [Desulfatibacillaceae bacterium]
MGEMASVAGELRRRTGVLEPMLTAPAIMEQTKNLGSLLEREASLPIEVVGFSWGAWVGCLLAGTRPELVRKLVLVGAPPFVSGYEQDIAATRRGRLGGRERAEVETLSEVVEKGRGDAPDRALARLGELLARADAFDPAYEGEAGQKFSARVFNRAWPTGDALRRSGRLLKAIEGIQCPVVAVHGDYDPHPARAVLDLEGRVEQFRFILLEKCGHRPWVERHARERFFHILREELRPGG